jgi:hypothetical protein
MRPGRAAPCLLIERTERRVFGQVLVEADRKMLSHPDKERSAPSAALPGETGLRRNFFAHAGFEKF